MKKITFKGISLSVLALFLGMAKTTAQTYDWVGTAGTDFYTAANWTSTSGPVAFDDSSFKFVRVHNAGSAPVISQFVAWQPGVFDVTGGSLTVNADFNCFYNDWLNGTVTVNAGATFTCRNIMRVGREGQGTVEVNGVFQCNNVGTWQGMFIGALANGNGTVNVNNGGVVSGGYQVEVGTRDFYPTGTLNINTGGLSTAYWETWIGPNGTINVNGGTLEAGKVLNVGNLILDNAANTGTIGSVVGRLNINSGAVLVNQNDLEEPVFSMHDNANITIDNGTLTIKRTGVDFSASINAHITAGRIVPVAGKTLVVSYDGINTTVVAQAINSAETFGNNVFSAYPNPVADVLYVNSNIESDTTKITVYDIFGKQVLSGFTGLSGSINMSGISSGIYMVKAEAGAVSSIIKIVKL